MGDDDDILRLGEGVLQRRERVKEMASWSETGDMADSEVDGLIRHMLYAQKAKILDELYHDLTKTRRLVADGYHAYGEKIDYIESLIARIDGGSDDV